jgi:hypothetical protein
MLERPTSPHRPRLTRASELTERPGRGQVARAVVSPRAQAQGEEERTPDGQQRLHLARLALLVNRLSGVVNAFSLLLMVLAFGCSRFLRCSLERRTEIALHVCTHTTQCRNFLLPVVQ